MRKATLFAGTFLLLWLLGYTSKAIAGNFSTNPSEFFTQLEEFVAKTKREDAIKAVEQLKANSQKAISAQQLTDIIATCNVMQDRKMRVYPQFTNYLETVNILAASADMNKQFTAWNNITKDIANKSANGSFNKFERFVSFSSLLFEKLVLEKSTGKTWQVKTTDYNFKYDNDVPSVVFNEATLAAYGAKDTMTIYSTSGEFFPFDEKWKGKKGRITWERVKLDPTSIFCDVGNYEINMQLSEYSVEDAILHFPRYFNRPLKGRLTDKLGGKVGAEYQFPEFRSYELDIFLTDIAPQTKYYGGFGLAGAKVLGFGREDKKARLDFFSQEGKLVLSAFSNDFAVQDKKEVNAIGTSISLYFANDSIYHPNLTLQYRIIDNELRLVRDNKASSKIAFMSSYHALEANVDAIFWKLNTPVLDFQMVSQLKDNRVVFESYNLYEPERIEKYKRITDVDPVYALYQIAQGGDRQIEANRFAKYLNEKYTLQSILSSVFEMVEDGFIYYNVHTDIITIRDKVIHYIDARRKKVDYDRIALISESINQNAQLDMETKELLVAGVKKVTLSDSQNVIIYPKKGITRVHKNRDISVDGTIIAGSVDFTGKDFDFKYAPFEIEMDTIQQMQIYLKDESGKRETTKGLAPINTLIQDVTGTLFIDEANNKSGLKNLTSYPKFESKGNAFIYYDNPNLYNGAYQRDSFYFRLKPFNFEDIDEIQAEQLTFPGTMVTGKIFPNFDQTTSLREDFSLGFEKNTDAAGMPIYGKGKFSGSINMSNNGLIGNGNIEYMAGHLRSEKLMLLPDSMTAVADTFFVERKNVNGIPFPRAENGKVKVRWLPFSQGLIATMTERPFGIFDDKFTLRGSFILTDRGARGQGSINWQEAAIRSNDFAFESGSFSADSSDVVIKNEAAKKAAFNSYNVKSRVNADEMLAEFKANGKDIPIILPANEFRTTASEFYWIMKENLINIRMPEDGQGYFESTKKEQEGLKFQASGGVVNLSENTIKVDGVPFVVVADAKIQPQNTQVFIRPDAVIDTLFNALIVCDTANEYHTITKATVNLKSINEFTGNGEYRYKPKGMKKQSIFFDLITTKKDDDTERWYTTASTAIKEDIDFKLNPRIAYKGDAILDSRKQFLIFDGFAKLQLNTQGIDAQWFAFKDQINPDGIQIDVSTPLGEYKDTLSFGVVQDMDLLAPYATFLTKKRTPLDKYIFRATGQLDFNDEKNTYRIGNKERLSGKIPQGEIFTLLDNESKVSAEGKFTFGDSYELVNVGAGGKLNHDITNKTFEFKDMVIGFDFMLDEKLWESLAQAIRYFNAESGEVDYSKESFQSAAIQLIEEKSIGDFRRMISQNGYLPEKVKGLEHALILTNVNMVYDSTTLSIRSKGKFGVSFAGTRYVNRMVDGFIEFGVRRTGDYFNIYIETQKDPEKGNRWYYFTYTKGNMRVLSSDPTFNDMISGLKESKRMKADKKKGWGYNYELAPMLKRNQFVYLMRGETAPVEQPTPPPAPKPTANDTPPAQQDTPPSNETTPTETTPAETAPTQNEKSEKVVPDPAAGGEENIPKAMQEWEEKNKKGKKKKKKDEDSLFDIPK